MSWSAISDTQSSRSQSAWLDDEPLWLDDETASLESETDWLESENRSVDDTLPTLKDNHQTSSLTTILPFDISHLLSSNDPPSSQDAVVILECLRFLDDWITRLDGAIADAPSLLLSTSQWQQSISVEDQKPQRSDVENLRVQVQSVNSPIRLVPPEVWQLIFGFACHSDGVLVFKPEDPVYVVGQVCQQWRGASLRCPRLWSRFRVYGSRLLDLPQCASRLRAVLERSCSLPLDFSFACGCRPDTVEREMPETLISILMEHSARWRSAKFLEMTLGEALLLGNVRGLLPQLESITLELSWERTGSERTDMITAFEIAPELSRVVLCGVPLGQVVLDSHTKQNLQYLRVDHNGAGEDSLGFFYHTPSLSDILEDYPELRNVDLFCGSIYDFITWSEPPPLDTPRTVYANLTSLRVVDSAGLNLISLPNLTDLDVGLDGLRDYNQELFACVISLLQHSGCSLSSLHLHSAEWDEASMGVLLGLVPGLETLSISSSGGLWRIDEMMSLVICYLDESELGVRPVYVPRLRKLCIHLGAAVVGMKPEWTFVDGAFVDMVAMRAKCGLEVVRLGGVCEGEFMPSLSKDQLGQWEDMKERGLINACVWKD